MQEVYTKTIKIDAPIADVWEALTVPALMQQWMSEKALQIITDWSIGGSFTITGEGFENSGKVLKYEPLVVVSYSHLSSLSQLDDAVANYTVLEFTLSGNTEVTLHISNFPTETIYKHFVFYWGVALELLRQFVHKKQYS